MKKTFYSLRTVIISPLVIGFFLMLVMIVAVQSRSYTRTLLDQSNKHLLNISKTAQADVTNFAISPLRFTLALSNSIQYLYNNDLNNAQAVEDYFNFSHGNLHDHISQLDAVSFTTKDGEHFTGLLRSADNTQFSLLKKSENTNGALYIYETESSNSTITNTIPNYDPSQLAWNVPFEASEKAKWSDTYLSFFNELFIAAASPITKDGETVGVFAIHIRLNTINKILNKFNNTNKASVFIYDQTKNLISTSNLDEMLFTDAKQYISGDYSQNAVRDYAYRKPISELNDPIMLAAAQEIDSIGFDNIHDDFFEFELNKQKYFGYVAQLKDDYGLDWSVVTILSEKDLVGNLPNQQQNELLFILFCSSILGLFIYMVLIRVTRRIQNTATTVQELTRGNWTVRAPESSRISEVQILNTSLNKMSGQLKHSFENLKRRIAYDPLTSLYSRQGLIEAFKVQKTSHYAVIIFGVEKFRYINDSYGHEIANKVLIEISVRLKETLPKNCLLSRIGGDDFAAYIPHIHEEFWVLEIIEKINEAFKTSINIDGNSIVINKMYGVDILDGEDNIEVALRNANVALSYAKVRVSRYAMYTSDMMDESLKRSETISNIKQAINNEEFIPFYQPLVDLKTNKIVGAEALARWISPEQGLIPPYKFIQISEECGLIRDIGNQILHRACLDTKKLIDEGRWSEDFHLHVNVSVNQLLLDAFADDLTTILNETQLPTKNLTLEITESNVVEKTHIMIKNLALIKELGIGIAIDDFGTGYSSLTYLQDMEFDSLKIDRSFVSRLEEKTAESSIVASILAMTKNFNVPIVSEGIETEEQARILKSLGCQLGQGYYYSRPVPLDEWPDNLDLG